MEIERKFLIRQVPPILRVCPRVEIEQGYVAVEGNGGTQVRLRRADNQFSLTIKKGQGSVRDEISLPIGRAHFERLWALTEGRRLVKTRFRIPFDDLIIEVDVYRQPAEGLMVAEVEFPDLHRCQSFTPPPWFAEEVTGDHRFGNVQLAAGGALESARLAAP
ncbi:MAG: hypothetical protein QOE70_3403 [Chthoniobacter sp.]|jgi:CYTH domain-containing protein|nr:hypothetical protein [Chthoniobacter sp.]